jgi:hypothetical protein
MKELGWEKSRLRKDGSLAYCYVRGEEPHRHILVTPASLEGGPAVAYYEDEIKC